MIKMLTFFEACSVVHAILCVPLTSTNTLRKQRKNEHDTPPVLYLK